MSPESINRRKAALYADFSAYVSAQGISGRDTAAVAKWTASHEYVTIFLFSTGREQQLYAGGQLDQGVRGRYDPQIHGKLFPIRFADGLYQVAIGDNSQVRQRQLVSVAAFVIAGISFLLLFMWYTGRLTRRIINLSKEAAAVTAGDLERVITAPGSDELSALADSVDEMRRSVIERMGNEKRAWEANTELITAISHDIRTPMTAMLGYLGLLVGGTEDEATKAQLASSAYVKAMELKDLTDQLFRYFLVYGKAELEMEKETYDARVLLEQMLGEMEFDLQDAGYTMRRSDFEGTCSITVDPLFLKRVLDNLLSNIKKYADPEKPVDVASSLRDGVLTLRVSNGVAKLHTRKESTKIGLRTCEKIMRALGGSFMSENDGETFTAVLTLPIS
jgi:signal transduction histidine kinase